MAGGGSCKSLVLAYYPPTLLLQNIIGTNFGDAAAIVTLSAAAPSGATLYFTSCGRSAGVPTLIVCIAPAGVGLNLPLTLTVSGIAAPATSGDAASGQGISYSPPTMGQLVGPGVLNANTAGGQAISECALHPCRFLLHRLRMPPCSPTLSCSSNRHTVWAGELPQHE